jgi:hypothetical protein
MEFEFDAENAAVTARTSGFGSASAVLLVLGGTINSRDPDRLDGVFETVEAAGSGADGGTLGD